MCFSDNLLDMMKVSEKTESKENNIFERVQVQRKFTKRLWEHV